MQIVVVFDLDPAILIFAEAMVVPLLRDSSCFLLIASKANQKRGQVICGMNLKRLRSRAMSLISR